MNNYTYTVGQLVRVTDPSIPLHNVPGIIVSLGIFGGALGYFVVVAGKNPLAEMSCALPGNKIGWCFFENEISPFETTRPTGSKPLPASRSTLTPSARAIAAHLVREGSISGVEASAMYKTRQLPGRISELRHYGYDIASNFDADCLGQRYVRYHLVREPSKVVA